MKRNVLGRFINFIIVATLIAGCFTGCGKGSKGSGFFTYREGQATKTEEKVEAESEKEAEPEAVEASLYVVKSVDMAGESIAFYSLNVNRDIRYSYNLTTKFLDKYGKSTSSANFKPGTVVVVGDMLPSSGALSSVQMASSVWVYDEVTKFTVDEDLGMFTIAGSKYKITKDTHVFSDENEIKFKDITDQDVLTVTGKDDEIISVAVTTGHGYIQLKNSSLFVDSLIFVGDKIVAMIHGDEMLEIPEGTYKVTVANDGWGGSEEFTVVRNEITEIDLDSMKGAGPSYCDLIFEVPIDNCQVYLDGKLMPLNTSNRVKYGNHKLQVIADGYESWSKTLVVNSASATIEINLTESSGSTANSNTSSTNNTENSTNSQGNNSTNSGTENSTSTTGEAQNSSTDAELDYLTTISDMISTLLQ